VNRAAPGVPGGMTTPTFTREELVQLWHAVTQYVENSDGEGLPEYSDEHARRAMAKLDAMVAGEPQPPSAVDLALVLQNRMATSLCDKHAFVNAQSFTVFVDPSRAATAGFDGSLAWDLFEVDWAEMAGKATREVGLPVLDLEPEVDRSPDRDVPAPPDGKEWDDLDAALAYLAAGGVLCKVPDYLGSSHFRLLVVDVKGRPLTGAPA